MGGCVRIFFFFFFQAEDGIRDLTVTGVQTCALPISPVVCRADYAAWQNIPSSPEPLWGRTASHSCQCQGSDRGSDTHADSHDCALDRSDQGPLASGSRSHRYTHPTSVALLIVPRKPTCQMPLAGPDRPASAY